MTSPFKGVPKAQWAEVKANLAAERAARAALAADHAYTQAPADKPAPAAPEPSAQPLPEVVPPNLFSGQMRRLEFFGMKPGFRYRLFNDEGDNVARARLSGWEFVARDDVQTYDAVTPRNNDTGSNVREYVGVGANGEPLFAYLLRKPRALDDEHQFGANSREVLIHQQIENQIRNGTLGQQPGERRYSAGHVPEGTQSTLPPISINTR